MRIEQHEMIENLARLRQQGHRYTLKVDVACKDCKHAVTRHSFYGCLVGGCPCRRSP